MNSGACLCGGVRFELSEPLLRAGYCHCTHCQRRTGTAFSISGGVLRSALTITAGEDLLHSFTPPGGRPKVFCSKCGSHLFSGDLDADEWVAVRFGVLDHDAGIEPSFHAFVASAAPWDTIPDDGLERFEGPVKLP